MNTKNNMKNYTSGYMQSLVDVTNSESDENDINMMIHFPASYLVFDQMMNV